VPDEGAHDTVND